MGKPITNSIVARMDKEKKLAEADETYNNIIADAERHASNVLQEAHAHKETLIRQWELLGKQKHDNLVEEGERKAENVVLAAEKQATLMRKDLEDHFVDAVKNTSRDVVKKLLGNADAQIEYINELVKEFSKMWKI